MQDQELNKHHPFVFFALVFGMSLPFWLIGQMLGKSPLPDNIPLTDIGATLTPAIAACILIYRENGKSGLRQFVLRILDYRRIASKKWLLVSIFFMPMLYVCTYGAMRLANFPVSAQLKFSPALLMSLAMFLLAAMIEELAYSAYATDALQKRFSALATSLLIGVPWAVWHLPSMIQMGQTWQLIAWGLLATVAFRVITVWLYNNANCSLFAVILAHSFATTARSAFPGGRHDYELGNGAISYGIIIFAAVLVVVFWGGLTLSNFRGKH